MSETIWIAIIAGLPGLASLIVTAVIALKKTPHENKRTDAESEKQLAEAESIHQQVADRWAEHVAELMGKIEALQDEREADRKELAGLRMDIAQVRRENEEYRRENTDLKAWATRLVEQLARHAPNVEPVKFIRQVYE